MITEEEAKTKWCPFARTVKLTLAGRIPAWEIAGNRIAGRAGFAETDLNPEPCRCIASACMAWRWQPLMTSPEWIEAVRKAADELGDQGPSRIKSVKHVNANRAKYGLPDEPFRGWCGLAGKPEVT